MLITVNALTLCTYEQAYMGDSPEHGVLLVSLGTVALLGEPFLADKAHAEGIKITLKRTSRSLTGLGKVCLP